MCQREKEGREWRERRETDRERGERKEREESQNEREKREEREGEFVSWCESEKVGCVKLCTSVCAHVFVCMCVCPLMAFRQNRLKCADSTETSGGREEREKWKV